MQLSNKQKTSSEPFAPFFKFTSNLEHFEKKDEPHSICVSRIKDCELSD